MTSRFIYSIFRFLVLSILPNVSFQVRELARVLTFLFGQGGALTSAPISLPFSHSIPSTVMQLLAPFSFQFLVPSVWPLSAIGALGVLTLVGLFGVGACSRLCWASPVCCCCGLCAPSGALAVPPCRCFLVKGSARILVSNDSVGPCWLKNCLTFKFGASSNLDIDLTSEV